MFTAALALLLHGFYACLRLTGRTGSFPRPLTSQEEQEVIAAFENGDMGAREKLILHNMRLIPHVIKKFYTNASDQDDLISIGTIGLPNASMSQQLDSIPPGSSSAFIFKFSIIRTNSFVFLVSFGYSYSS